ncbi:MAG: class I SAM-dependent methyltransferase [Chloroflexi bacterium]|jgi:predicted TPR repeat methyltransferase|nr:class I SAM-dependent methyltransferase [Chloroflexota bacterium]
MSLFDASKRLQKVFAAQDNQALQEAYDTWAETYEQDMFDLGYKIPVVMSGLIGRYVRPNGASILDAGTGTGLLGETMTVLGYRNLTGIDLSQRMLKEADKKDVYQILRQMTLGNRLDFPDNTFDATISQGVFSVGHAPARAFTELIRVTKTGGYIIFSVRVDALEYYDAVKEEWETLQEESEWQRVEVTKAFQNFPTSEPEVRNKVLVYEVC